MAFRGPPESAAVGASLLAETYMLGSQFEAAGTVLDEGLSLAEAADERFWEPARKPRMVYRGIRNFRLARGETSS